MDFLKEIHLPFTNPVVIFAIVLFIILLSPIVLKRFKIPGIVGLIISGMIVGPNGLNLLAMDSSIILFGTIGLLYIMFLAGVELDLNEFRKSKFQSLFYGTIIISLSLIIGFIVFRYLLNFSVLSSVLIGAMVSTFTLVSYPIVSRLGLVSQRSMVLAVGGVIITDLVALIVLVLTKSLATQTGSGLVIFQILIGLVFVIIVTFFIFPRIAKWYFRNIEEIGTWQFIFVLALLFTSAFVAQIAGFEAIIGAFAAGLALNPLIPKNSSLLDRINFFGNSLFIPFFLIQVGMLIDISVIFTSWEVIGLAVLLMSISFLAKFSAAYIIQKIYKYSKTERNFLFGLSYSQAAALIAIVLVGFQTGILNEKIFNSSVLIVLVSCLVSSFITEFYGRKLAIEKVELPNQTKSNGFSQKILVSVSKPQSIPRLIEFGAMIKDPGSTQPIVALTIIANEDEVVDKVATCDKFIAQASKEISPVLAKSIITSSRINLNVSTGLSNAIKENLITDIIIGLNEKNFGKDKVFGNIMQNLLEDTNQTVFAVRNLFPLNTVDNILILFPEFVEFEPGFRKAIYTIINLAVNAGTKLSFYGLEKTLQIVQNLTTQFGGPSNSSYTLIKDYREYLNWQSTVKNDDMIIGFLSRPKSISHNLIFEDIIENLVENISKVNIVILYPEQNPALAEEDISHYDVLETSPIQENIALLKSVRDYILKLFRR